MPTRKTLPNIARGMAESFTSLMNYVDNDYVLGHLVFAAWESGDTELVVDLLSGETNDSKLLSSQVQKSLERYVACLPDMVARSNSEPKFLAKAELVVLIRAEVRPMRASSKLFESPYSCLVRLLDDRGKWYFHQIDGWWYPEQPAPSHIREAGLRQPSPNKGFNRTQESSGPAKPGEPSGGAG